jgi:hypothetical protein
MELQISSVIPAKTSYTALKQFKHQPKLIAYDTLAVICGRRVSHLRAWLDKRELGTRREAISLKYALLYVHDLRKRNHTIADMEVVRYQPIITLTTYNRLRQFIQDHQDAYGGKLNLRRNHFRTKKGLAKKALGFTNILKIAVYEIGNLVAHTELIDLCRPVRKRSTKPIVLRYFDRYQHAVVKIIAHCCQVSQGHVVDWCLNLYMENFEMFEKNRKGIPPI